MRLVREEEGQGLLVVLALVGLVSAVAYGYMALAASANQQATLRATQLGEYRASDSGATYSLWYGTNKGFPPAGALSAPDPGDGLGAPAVTITDLRPALSFGPLHNKNHGAQTYDSVAHTLVGSGDVFYTVTWTTDAAGRGTLNIRFDTTPVQAGGFAAQATVTMPAGQVTTTSTVNLPTSGPGTYYLHLENTTSGSDLHLSSSGAFRMNYPGMRFQAISARTGRTTALDAGLTRNAGTYSATVNSWTLR
ncbi:MAG: hypothetical protein AUH85_04290 [Chloroflexi bacterium 13_1_40CM_4_68_4]|nr:MAG: hypothetical protein AUH85_04290 [Chloroflexi bacterium 13_1_40CM_4_68_4]